jgi:hypothetical protein
MKKTIKTLSLILVLITGLFLMTGCNKSNEIEEKLYGTWANLDIYDVTFTFNEDKTGSEVIDTGMDKVDRTYTYEVDNEVITIVFDDDEDKLEYEYEYRFDDEDLVLIDSAGTELVYKKK